MQTGIKFTAKECYEVIDFPEGPQTCRFVSYADVHELPCPECHSISLRVHLDDFEKCPKCKEGDLEIQQIE